MVSIFAQFFYPCDCHILCADGLCQWLMLSLDGTRLMDYCRKSFVGRKVGV